ncbi:MAG: hypothetical protein AB8F94_26200 [Saprospiraceae bacterium]
MADNKNNLENFFKNRINDFDGSNDDWDLPDESSWENAQPHFPKYPKMKTWDWKLGVLILLVFSMIVSGSYIYFLKKNLIQKTTELELAHAEIENKNNTITSLKKETKAIGKTLSSEQNNVQNAISSLTQQQQISTQTIFSQKKTIQVLQIGKQQLKQELILTQANFVVENESDFLPNDFFTSNFSTKKLNEILENTIPIASSFLKVKNDFPKQKLDLESEFKVIFPKLKKRRSQFEIGINYSSMNFEIPLIYDFEKLEKEDFGKKNGAFSLKFTGGEFHLAYKVRPRLWIRTGVRRTTGGFEKSFSDKLIYDKSGEYLDDEGKTINEFDITTQSGFGDAGSTINFEIPNGTAIDDGDFLETKWNYSQQYKFTHIPIGVTYFIRENKFQWFFTGGFGWNKVSFGEFFVEAQLSYDGEIFPVKESKNSKGSEVSSQFINGFGGAGLNYQLTPNWNIRTSFTMEKNFIQKNKMLTSNSLSKIFDIGLNYRF